MQFAVILFYIICIVSCKPNIIFANYELVLDQSKTLIREFEGLKLKRYKGLGHKEYVIGYGDKECAIKYKTITKEQAESCLDLRVNEIYARLKQDLPSLKPNQYASLISLIYNVGYGAFERSNLYQCLQSHYRNKSQIKGEWLDFNHLNGKVLDGLTARRIQEYQLFIKV